MNFRDTTEKYLSEMGIMNPKFDRSSSTARGRLVVSPSGKRTSIPMGIDLPKDIRNWIQSRHDAGDAKGTIVGKLKTKIEEWVQDPQTAKLLASSYQQTIGKDFKTREEALRRPGGLAMEFVENWYTGKTTAEQAANKGKKEIATKVPFDWDRYFDKREKETGIKLSPEKRARIRSK
jgi:hypothetical protein